MAEMNPDLQNAFQMARNTGTQTPFYQQSLARINQAHAQPFAQSHQQYMNPYIQNVVTRLGEEGGRTLREQVLPQLSGQFASLGQHGSSRHADLAASHARDIQNDILARQQQALASGFGQAAHIRESDIGQQLAGARDIADLGRMTQIGHMADTGALMQQGQFQLGREQQGLNTGYEDFLRQQQQPQQNISQHAAILTGLPQPQQFSPHTTTSTGTPGEASWNTMGQLGNIAGTLYGARRAGGFPGFKTGGHVNNDELPRIKGLSSFYMKRIASR